MSNFAITAVLMCSKSKGAQRLALLVIADRTFTSMDYFHDEYGINKLAELCNCTVRPMQRCLNGESNKKPGLVQMGELVIWPHAGPRGTDRYQIPILPGEPGYDPQPCHDGGQTHICNGTHTPLDMKREAIWKADRDRRLAEQGERPTPRGGAKISTRAGVNISTTPPEPPEVVSILAPPPANISTTPVSKLAPQGANISTPLTHRPSYGPIETQRASPPAQKMERAEPEPEGVTWGEMSSWCRTRPGRLAMIAIDSRYSNGFMPRAADMIAAWNTAHPNRVWGVPNERIVEGSIADSVRPGAG